MKKNALIMTCLLISSLILAGCGTKTTEEVTEKPSIPENCIAWFDGCNNCFVQDGKIGGCTLMACHEYKEPKCMQYMTGDDQKNDEKDNEETKNEEKKVETTVSKEETPKIPEDCTNWFDGCNNCFVKDGEIGGCTKMACEVQEEQKCTEFKK